ncbi:exonuclease [Aspergillus campestris IBT 28561]|uniref:Exonuclease n=1 Tax=Aspergillus campestris (strain IBT 28561) TaxID=1392248 RepID=A0A2I1DHM0_ASPC2|nr:exonuclease [Aspergillus campestris IBT 28561]PKY09371.1 exonuclease [Aspergillus campestris IBT 28561]
MYKTQTKSTPDKVSSQDPSQIEDDEVAKITFSLQSTTIDSSVGPQLVSTRAGIVELVGEIADLPTSPPSLFVDLEGVNLSRHGTISILQIYAAPLDRTYLVDVHILKEKAFSQPAGNGMTLKDVLELSSIPKVFFDVRHDSDALFAHFGVRLAGVQDLQLMEVATRQCRRRFLSGLAKCIEFESSMTPEQKGGSYEGFNTRPLSSEILQYCAQDVGYLPGLWRRYDQRLTAIRDRRAEVEQEVERRISDSQHAAYNGNGRHMARAPPRWAYLS